MSRLKQTLLLGFSIALSQPQGLVAERLYDPTRPLDYSPHVVGEDFAKRGLQLSSVIITSKRSIVVINSERLTLNDEIAGYRIISIEPGKVVLRNQAGELVKLSMVAAGVRSGIQGQGRRTVMIKRAPPGLVEDGKSYAEQSM